MGVTNEFHFYHFNPTSCQKKRSNVCLIIYINGFVKVRDLDREKRSKRIERKRGNEEFITMFCSDCDKEEVFVYFLSLGRSIMINSHAFKI